MTEPNSLQMAVMDVVCSTTFASALVHLLAPQISTDASQSIKSHAAIITILRDFVLNIGIFSF